MLELVIVLMISAMAMGMLTQQYARVEQQRAVANARDAMIMTAYRARAEAMQSGRVVYMRVRPDSGLVRVGLSSGEVLHTLRSEEFGTRMVGASLSVCYTARGYALPGCTDFSGEADLEFIRGADTAAVTVASLGQVRRER